MRTFINLTSGLVLTLVASSLAHAVSPASVEQGRQLFEHQWTSQNPRVGSDGLGPVFNGTSCVSCHHQNGIGGGGDARFNAHTLSIEKMQIVGPGVTEDVVRRMVGSFYPGFVQADGQGMVNIAPLIHHGGSRQLESIRKLILGQLSAKFSESGGAAHPEEVRFATSTPVLFTNQVDRFRISINARLFQRNSTALFGAGLIDQVTEKHLDAQVRAQKRHPEIAGRPSTMRDGRYGKFGWRAQIASLVEFTDLACANELGLETKRQTQPADPLNPGYRNPGVDITDDRIRALASFIAALPQPTKTPSNDHVDTKRGEAVFHSVGCAVCHVPELGPAKGIYSDLLLHDMGPELRDLNHAKPYIVDIVPVAQLQNQQLASSSSSSSRSGGSSYGGGSTAITTQRPTTNFQVAAPNQTPVRDELVQLGTLSKRRRRSSGSPSASKSLDRLADNTGGDMTLSARLIFKPTNFNQEWRTPPLWGVADSAPYLHDGRAETLLEAIMLHEGESKGTRDRFLNLSLNDRNALFAFLNSLVAPPNVPQPSL